MEVILSSDASTEDTYLALFHAAYMVHSPDKLLSANKDGARFLKLLKKNNWDVEGSVSLLGDEGSRVSINKIE